MTLGAERLLRKYKTVGKIAEAMIDDRISNYDLEFARQLVWSVDLTAAKMRIELRMLAAATSG